jgi:hypothetical protein
MGADFSVGGVTLTQFREKCEALGTVLDEVNGLEAQLQAKAGDRDGKLDDLCRILLNYRQAVSIAEGKESREYTTVPKLPRSRKAAEAAPKWAARRSGVRGAFQCACG